MKADKSQVLLSPEDEDLLQYSLFVDREGYLKTGARKFNSRMIHSIVAKRIGITADWSKRILIDHINRNKFDNRRENLRLVNHEINTNNSERILNSKGYYFNKKINKFVARIVLNGKKIDLGKFSCEKKARKAYVEAKNKRLTELGLSDLLIA